MQCCLCLWCFFIFIFLNQVWKAILTGPLALLTVALSTADNPFPTKQMSGEKCVSWTPPIELERVKEIKLKTGTFVVSMHHICGGEGGGETKASEHVCKMAPVVPVPTQKLSRRVLFLSFRR